MQQNSSEKKGKKKLQQNDQEQNTQCNKITKNKTHNATK